MSDGVRSADFLVNASALCRSCHSRSRELDIVYIKGLYNVVPGVLSYPSLRSERVRPWWCLSESGRLQINDLGRGRWVRDFFIRCQTYNTLILSRQVQYKGIFPSVSINEQWVVKHPCIADSTILWLCEAHRFQRLMSSVNCATTGVFDSSSGNSLVYLVTLLCSGLFLWFQL